mmetsp:Transcript_61098/g.69971  ORF Transcript_61098/g.69971 Transcript_61098/m.69971 type:complete len:92 (-) Transcript_61098:124-399(-)
MALLLIGENSPASVSQMATNSTRLEIPTLWLLRRDTVRSWKGREMRRENELPEELQLQGQPEQPGLMWKYKTFETQTAEAGPILSAESDKR